jgi:hypothetical protein
MCSKWRMLKTCQTEWDGDFNCKMNTWDKWNSCSIPEQQSSQHAGQHEKEPEYPNSRKRKRPRPTGLEGGENSKMVLIPLDPIARVSTMEAFHLPAINKYLYVGSAEVCCVCDHTNGEICIYKRIPKYKPVCQR